ncbi:MAG: hypothetical protein ABH843_01805 [Candidatus Omnitrophota bacterium]
MRSHHVKNMHNPTVTRWETKTAEFLQIELSPSHIFRIRIDKIENKKEGGESA